MKRKSIIRILSSVLVASLLTQPLGYLSVSNVHQVQAAKADEAAESAPYLISTNKTVTVSSVRNNDANSGADKLSDGSNATRWESEWVDTAWVQYDLGVVSDITSIYLNWEGACATNYEIQYSTDGNNWTTKKTVTDGKAGEITFEGSEIEGEARYVRLECYEKSMPAYGYSLYEMQIYGYNGLYKVNLAQGKPAEGSSFLDEWWMYDGEGNIKPGETPDAENAVDGNASTRWRSSSAADGFVEGAGQWVSVDLEKSYLIGEVDITWDGSAAATVYDLQLSNDGKEWTTVYRTLNGDERKQTIKLHNDARYVRVLARSKYRDAYVAIKELEVYKYIDGDEIVTHNIPELPVRNVVQVTGEEGNGKGSYNSNDIYFANQARDPKYLAEDLSMPIASNDWWQSILINDIGNAMSVLPLKVKFDKKNGFGVLTMGQSYWKPADDYTQGAVTSTTGESQMDFWVVPTDFNTDNVYNEVAGYGDYHVKANFYDGNGLVMTTTHVKGNPYTYLEFNNKKEVLFNSIINSDEAETASIVEIFNGSGNAILANVGDSVTADHIGLKVVDNDNEEKTMTSVSYYCVTAPENTVFTRTEDGISVSFAGNDMYMSIATMTDKSQIDLFYKHGYAFVTDTVATYNFEESTNVITSSYNLTTKVMRAGFTDQSIQSLFPHQWDKYSPEINGGKGLSDITYHSARGDMRVFEGNSFSMSDNFYGMLPEFTTPENEEYDEEELLAYLANLEKGTQGNLIGSDAYWQGKSLHPLGMGVLVADQIGNTEYRDIFLSRIKTIMEDWYTYDGPEDEAFFFYDEKWGTLYYKDSEFGANKDISDHHFTYGYLLFASSVLATYDHEFYEDYKDMMNLLVRDFASPYEEDEMFCKFRSFDPYEGHSWAGGYADNDGGNNQEAASESLFGWVGMYLWSQVSENKDFRDAAIYGFTTEINAIKHYWFDYYEETDAIDGYDRSGWPADWPSKSIGQVYGSNYFYGTFFGGYPIYVYGIHWLPVTEYMTHYGMEQKQAGELYQGLLTDTQGQKDAHPEVTDYPDTKNSWQHIALPFLALTDADQALSELDRSTQSMNEGFNTYWFLNNMKDLGQRTSDIYAMGGVSATVYEKEVNGEKVYTAMAWNPTDHSLEVTFKDTTGKTVGSATIGAKSLLRLNPTQTGAIQAQTPEFSIPAGTYDNTQYVKITCATEGATIHYTTDGSSPNENSPVYDGRIPVSSTTTIKAVAIKDGYIKSSVKSAKIVINGSSITTGTNIAKGKEAVASSTEGGNAANLMLDGEAGTRWSSLTTDDEYCYVDLGDNYNVNKVKIYWEASYASKYEIQVSQDAQNWTTVYTEDAGKGGFEEIIFAPVEARYVKMQGIKRATDYGYSIYEMGIYEARQASIPQFSLESGSYVGNQLLSIASGTNGVEIRYTTDGSEPTKDSKLYIPRLTLFENTTIKAKAFKEGMIPSETASAEYQISGGSNPGNVDNYDENDSFKVEVDPVIEEEKIAGEVENDGSDEESPQENPLITGNLAYKKKVTVTSSENANSNANVTDGDLNTTWSSAFAEGVVADRHKESCYIDLKESVEFNQVTIYWALNTPGNQYEIQVSDDAQDWKTVYVYDKATGEGNVDISSFDTVSARYVKMQGTKIGADWGYAIREMTVTKSEEEQPFGENIAANAKITVTGSDEGYQAGNMKDGNADTAWKLSGTDNAECLLDLQKAYQIDKVTLQLDGYTGTYKVSVSTDGENFTSVKEAQSTAADKETVSFETTEARFVKVEFSGATNGIAVKELEVYTVGSTEAVEEEINYFTAVSADSSTKQADEMSADMLIDGDSRTRWASAQESDNEWCVIDLGENNVQTINRVEFNWETAYAEKYTIDVSTDGENFTTVSTVENGEGGVEVITFPDVEARYIRMQGVERATAYGYSIYEMRAGYAAPIRVTSVLMSPSVARMNAGETLQLKWSINPSNATNQKVTFKSANESIVKVDEKGLLQGLKAGETTVMATTQDGGLTAQTTVKVKGALTAPTVTASKNDTNSILVSWSAVENAVAYEVYVSNSSDGTYKKLGETDAQTTTYTTEELTAGNYYFKVIAKADANSELYLDSTDSNVTENVVIENATEEVEVQLSLDSYSGTVEEGGSITVTATVEPTNTEVTWRSEEPTIAYVNNGVITALKEGNVVITASAGDKTVEYHLTVTKKEDSGNEGGDTGNEGGNTGNEGGNTGNTGNEGGDTGNEGGNSGNEGGNTGNEGGNTGNEGGNTGNEGGNTGNEGGNTGNEGGNTGNEGGNSGNEGGDTGNEGGNSGNEGGNTGNEGGNTGTGSGNTGNQSGNTGNNGGTGSQSGSQETPVVKVETIKVTGISKKIAAGKKIVLTTSIEPENATDKSITWTSSNPKYATVDANGCVSVKKTGKNKKVIITASANDGSGIKTEYKITIMPNAVKKLTVKAATKTVKAGKKLTLKATVTPNLSKKKMNKDIKWTSSNTKYATVSKKGVVKTKKAGKGKSVKITATTMDGSNKKKTITIKIK